MCLLKFLASVIGGNDERWDDDEDDTKRFE